MRLNRLRVLLAGLVVVAGLGGIVLAQSAPPQSKSAPTEDEFLKGAYPANTAGLTAPKTKREVKPKYTPDAMRMKIQGSVKLQVVVAVDGTVDRARVTQSLHPELDIAALEAIRQWTFEPGMLKDKAVPVYVDLTLEFRLH